jgi:hypothetical protein
MHEGMQEGPVVVRTPAVAVHAVSLVTMTSNLCELTLHSRRCNLQACSTVSGSHPCTALAGVCLSVTPLLSSRPLSQEPPSRSQHPSQRASW